MASGETTADMTVYAAHLKYNAMLAMAELIKLEADNQLMGHKNGSFEQIPIKVTKVLNKLKGRTLMERTVLLLQRCATEMINQNQLNGKPYSG